MYMKHWTLSALRAAIVAAADSGCTVKKDEAPDLAGPSEYGLSIVISVTPDVLEQNGASQSLVTVTARDPDGQPMRNVVLRVETLVNGSLFDFGTLSARSVVTGNDGRATLVYTAPAAPNMAVDNFTIVDIGVTPVGSDFGNSAMRSASIRVVPPNIIVPPDGLRPRFTFTPTAPTDHQRVLFDASTSEAPSNNPIMSFSWNFGDGGTGTGPSATHDYSSPGTYVVTLTISDAYGRAASTSQTLNVGAGVNPTASFTFSPTDPLPGTVVNFNAAASRAAPGRTIVSYTWDFGDGTTATGMQVAHRYGTLPATYTVTLVVVDDAGRRGTTSTSVPVQFPDEESIAPARKKGGTLRD